MFFLLWKIYQLVYFFVPGSCFDVNYDRVGLDKGILGSIASPDDCQSLCQLNTDCDFFVYFLTTEECFLKNGASKKYESNNVITGPKYCNGN